MGDLLFYLLKSGCYLIIFYLLFKLLMSGTTFFRFNRVTILAGIIGCMFLPLIEFTTQEETFLTVPLQTIQGIFVGAWRTAYFGTQCFGFGRKWTKPWKYAGYKLVSYCFGICLSGRRAVCFVQDFAFLLSDVPAYTERKEALLWEV